MRLRKGSIVMCLLPKKDYWATVWRVSFMDGWGVDLWYIADGERGVRISGEYLERLEY